MKRDKPEIKIRQSCCLAIMLGLSLFSFAFAASPQIDPDGIFELPNDCIYDDFEAELEVIDTDGDYVTISTNYGIAVTDTFYWDTGGTSHWHGSIDFNDVEICGQSFQSELLITATDGSSAPDTLIYGPIDFVGTMTVSMSEELPMWPGLEEWMPIYLDVGNCFCLGGFSLTVAYDSEALDVTEAVLGEVLDGNEINFSWIEDPYIEGTDKFVFIINPNISICSIDPSEPILYLKFLLDPEPADTAFPVDFHVTTPYYSVNSMTDKTGLALWYLEGCIYGELDLQTVGGNIIALNEQDVVLGDLNLNGTSCELEDLQIAHNAVYDAVSYPLNPVQRYAADMDSDQTKLSINDLVLFNYCYNSTEPAFYGSNPANDTLRIQSAYVDYGEELSLPIYLTTHDTLLDFQAYILADPDIIIIDSVVFSGEITMAQTLVSGFPHILSLPHGDYSLPGPSNWILPGTYHLGDIVGRVHPDIQDETDATVEFGNDSTYLTYTGLANGTYIEPVLINSVIHIGSDVYEYFPGDANMFAGQWPPQLLGNDVTYLVNYFRGITLPCLLDGFWASADFNGDCSIIGSDVTVMVRYFRGLGPVMYCIDYPPAWLSEEDLPPVAPSGWPNCGQ